MTAKRLFVAIVVAFAALAPAVARAAPPTAVGWWQRGVTEAGGVPGTVTAPPPTPTLVAVPDGGLYVANDPSGARAVSALRFEDSVAAAATVVLRVAGDPVLPFGARLLACPASGPWQPAVNGPWNARPAADCAAGVEGAFGDDLTTVTFDIGDLPGFRTTRGIEAVVLPAADEAVVFGIAFEKPLDGTVVFRGDPPPMGSVPAPERGPAPALDSPTSDAPTPAAVQVPLPGPGDEVLDAPAPSAQDTALAPVTRRGESRVNRISIGTDGVPRAVLTALIILLAGGAWIASGGLPAVRRRPSTQETRP